MAIAKLAHILLKTSKIARQAEALTYGSRRGDLDQGLYDDESDRSAPLLSTTHGQGGLALLHEAE